jgi:hypothetical protein
VEVSGGRDPSALDAQAAAYAETGQFAKALETERRAVALATGSQQQSQAEAMKARMTLYAGDTPFHSR